MPDHFHDAMRHLTRANEHSIAANQAIIAACEAMQRRYDADAAKGDTGDLKEALARLEALILECGRELRALRDDHEDKAWAKVVESEP
jgi:hypothetical protein